MIIALDGFQFHHISWHIHMNRTRIKNKIKLNVAQFTNAGADEKLLTNFMWPKLTCRVQSRQNDKKVAEFRNTGNNLLALQTRAAY